MTNLFKLSLLGLLTMLAFATQAEAMAINRCTRIVQDQAGRETVVNICKQCITVNLERRRPGKQIGTPSMRTYNLPAGSRQPLAFRGPGITRIMGETPCPGSAER